ncbi:MAG TPA: tetratricopeptide repeat protein [Caldilineae bacterium]|nr:tetratricopeptide repeat protein [Caldilineae bacterium]
MKPLPSVQLNTRWLSSRWIIAALLLLITALAAGLRFYHLGTKGLWVDEIFTATFASAENDWGTVARRALSTPIPSPPLWFWITHLFIKAFGGGNAVVRLPSAIAGILGVLAIYKVGETLFDRTTGIFSAFLLAISPMHLHFSQEARFYAAIVLFSLLSLYFLYQGLNSEGKRWWLGFTVITLINLYIHLTTFLVLAAEIVYAVVMLSYDWFAARKAGRGKSLLFTFAPLLASLCAIALGYAPMVPYLLLGVQSPRGLGNAGHIQGLDLSPGYFLSLFAYFGAGTGIALSLYVAAFLWGLFNAARERKRQAALILLWISVPFVIVVLLRPKHWFAPKYVISILPLYLITISWGLVNVARSLVLAVSHWEDLFSSKLLQAVSLTCLVAIYGLMSASVLDVIYAWQQGRWQEIARFLNANARPGDVIVIVPLRILTMSAQEIMAYYGPKPDEMDVVVAGRRERIEELLAQHERVWIIIPGGWAMPNLGIRKLMPPDLPYVTISLGGRARVLYTGEGQSLEALLEEAKRFTNLTATAYGSIGDAYRSLEMWDEALTAYTKAAAMEPERGVWHYRQALVYEQQGQFDRALAEYREAIRLQPEISGFHAALGHFYSHVGLTDQAISEYREAIRLYVSQNRDGERSKYVRSWRDKIRELEMSVKRIEVADNMSPTLSNERSGAYVANR